MKFHCVALLSLAAVCLIRDALAFSSGAPTTACTTLTQQHSGVTPVACGPPCPYSVSLVAVDGAPPISPNMYRCGSQHTSEYGVIMILDLDLLVKGEPKKIEIAW